MTNWRDQQDSLLTQENYMFVQVEENIKIYYEEYGEGDNYILSAQVVSSCGGIVRICSGV